MEENTTRFNTAVIQWLFSSLQQTPRVKIFDNNTIAPCLGGFDHPKRLLYTEERSSLYLEGRIRKLSQHYSDLLVVEPPLRIGPLIRRSG